MKRLRILIIAIGLSHFLYSQSRPALNIPPEYQQAYKNHTRSPDGKPGPAYWQNHSDYELKAIVDPGHNRLKGNGTITYYNNSPYILDSLVFTLTSGKSSDSSLGNEDVSSGEIPGTFTIEKIALNNMPIDLNNRKEFERKGTAMVVTLPKPLEPDSSVTVYAEWEYILSVPSEQKTDRTDKDLFVGHWYPEIAVFDDISGWNYDIQNDGSKSYHDFSNYKIELQVPDNFLVWASVPPLNQEKIYPDYILQRLKKVNEKNPTFIVTSDDIRKGIKVRSDTWKYEAGDFPDFSFAISNHFIWAAQSFQNQGSYLVNAVYPASRNRFYVDLKASCEALDVFTRTIPAYPYPFKYITVFNGLDEGGTDFPGMTNIAFEDSTKFGVTVTALEANRRTVYHQMFHMYFPFSTGINELKYEWMDEGWALFTTYLIAKPYGIVQLDRYARPTVVPMMVSSGNSTGNTRANANTAAAYSYYSLEKLMGKQIFVKCLQEYLKRWQHKHPVPYDFFNTFNGIAGRDLTWFWKKWYFDWGYMDLGIEACDGKSVTIANLGGRPVAFSLNLYYYDSPMEAKEINPLVWKDNYSISIPANKDKILIRAEIQVPFSDDIVTKNNQWKTR